MTCSNLSSFPWPAIPGEKELPKWEDDRFMINGKKLGSLICYDQTESNWSEHLTKLHEEEAGNGKHPIDIASRKLALRSLSTLANHNEALILEVGCSSGFLLHDLKDTFPHLSIIGSDYLAQPLHKLSQNLPSIPLLQFNLQTCPLPDNSVDVTVALNVLEHIENDQDALWHLYRILRPGGIAHIEVPAGPELFDIYDEYLMHYRRYVLKEIISKAQSVGFKIQYTTHLGFSLYPVFWIVKKLNRNHLSKSEEQKRKIVSRQIRKTKNSFLMQLAIELEIKLGSIIKYPCGIRCVIVCSK